MRTIKSIWFVFPIFFLCIFVDYRKRDIRTMSHMRWEGGGMSQKVEEIGASVEGALSLLLLVNHLSSFTTKDSDRFTLHEESRDSQRFTIYPVRTFGGYQKQEFVCFMWVAMMFVISIKRFFFILNPFVKMWDPSLASCKSRCIKDRIWDNHFYIEKFFLGYEWSFIYSMKVHVLLKFLWYLYEAISK